MCQMMGDHITCSVPLTDIPVEVTVDNDPEAADSDIRHKGTGSESERMDSDLRQCDSNPANRPTLTCDSVQLYGDGDSVLIDSLTSVPDCPTTETGRHTMSRAGRFFKPVKRLIETMQTQKVLGSEFKSVAVWV